MTEMTERGKEMLNAALEYAAKGWPVIPCHTIKDGACTCRKKGKCASQGKHPCTINGLKDASTDPEVIHRWFTRWQGANIAIVMRDNLVVDIDGEEGLAQWEDLRGANPDPDTWRSWTGGGGQHFMFAWPESLSKPPGKLAPKIDIRARGSYIIAPPSLHLSGRKYDLELNGPDGNELMPAEPPEWLLAFLLSEKKKLTLVRESGVRIAKGSRDNALTSECGKYRAVGMGLEEMIAALTIFNEKYCDPPKSAADIKRICKSCARYEPDIPEGPMDCVIDLDGGPNNPQGNNEQTFEINNSLYENMPGILNLICRYVRDTQIRDQPGFAANAALAVCATAMARNYAFDHLCSRTNLYLISVGKTASGKDRGLQAVKEILIEAGLENRIGGETIASGQAIFSRLEFNPACIFQIDEFGKLLKATNAETARRYNLEIMTNFMKLFSSANSTIFGTEYADQKTRPRQEIMYPCAALHCATTPGEFYGALSSRDVVSGFINRFLVVQSNTRPVMNIPIDGKPRNAPDGAINWIRAVAAQPNEGGGNILPVDPTNPIKIMMDPKARELYRKFIDEVDKKMEQTDLTGGAEIWSRAVEHCGKLAMIGAVADYYCTREVSADVMTWAIDFTFAHVEALRRLVDQHMSDSRFEASLNSFYDKIQQAGPNGITITESSRLKPFRGYPMKVRSELLASLIQSGHIVLGKTTTGGRPRSAYIAAIHAPLPSDESKEAE